MTSLGLAWKFALRELRGGLAGFFVFLGCIALGVGAIAGVNSVAASITSGIASEGQAILGGDLAVETNRDELPEGALAFLQGGGVVSKTVNLRGMARLPDGSDQTLVELKAVDGAYPLYGNLSGAQDLLQVDALDDDSAYVEPILLERLGVQVGDRLAIGLHEVVIRAAIADEPDRLASGIGFGPRLMVTHGALEKAGLIRPGSIFSVRWAVKLDDASEAGLNQFTEALRERFGEAGWRIRSRGNAAPALSRNILRFSQFLTLVGLSALIVGGVGVANSVRAFLDTKRNVIATFKSLGASGRFVFQVYLIQIMVLALAGIAVGLALGAAMPIIAREVLGDLLPVAGGKVFHPGALGLGAAYGLLTAFVFTVWPLGKARDIPVAALFRATGFDGAGWPRLSHLAMIAAGMAILIALALAFSGNREIATIFLAAMGGAFVLLRLVSLAIQYLARKSPRVKGTALRMAVANIHRPGSLTPSVVLSLGLGLALICALALIDTSLRAQIAGNLPQRAPAFFFVDIQSHEMDGFRQTLEANAPEGKVVAVPMLRGRVISLKGIAAEDYKAEEGRWVLRGDRGVTYARNLPENSTVAAGEWWDPDHSGEPLVSFSAEEAGELGLEVGDMISVSVLGRTVTARIANLRNVEWESLAINFVMVFSPNTFAGAPHGWLATLTLPDGAAGGEAGETRDGRILKAVAQTFPTITSVRVRDALETVNGLIGQLALAIRAASSVALIASLLVLAGALAAGNRARTHDSVVLKTLGASRKMLARTFALEYGLIGLATALFALGAGWLAAWFVVTRIMTFPAIFDPVIAASVIAVALVVTIGLGFAGTWRLLGQKAAPYLRETAG